MLRNKRSGLQIPNSWDDGGKQSYQTLKNPLYLDYGLRSKDFGLRIISK